MNDNRIPGKYIMKINQFIKLLPIVLFLLFRNLFAAADYGEIVGTVTDQKTGEPLPFANVVIVSTTLGAATDEKGEFRIGQIPAGTYSVQARFMGYRGVTIENVRVSINRITRLDFELPDESLVTEAVVITAKKPPVDVEVSSSAQMISADEIKNMPVATNVKDLVSLQSGVVKEGVNIHIRGGRSDEILYLIDGVPARNPITGVSSVEIDVNQIEEIEIMTGGFDAEYGNANSGIINIITKSGRDRFTADAVFKTDKLFGGANATNFDYVYLGLSGPVPLLDNSGFTLSGRMEGDDTYYRIGGGYGTTNFLGMDIKDRQYGSYSVMAQFNYQPWRDLRIKLSANSDRYTNKGFSWSWSRIPEALPITKSESNRFTALISHTLSKESYYDISVAYQSGKAKTSLLGLNSPVDAFSYVNTYYDYEGNRIPDDEIEAILHNNPSIIDFSKTKSIYQRPTIQKDVDSDGFFDEGEYSSFYKDEYKELTFSFDYTHFTGIHKLKTGFEGNYRRINKLEIQNYGLFIPGRDTIPGEWPQYGDTRWYYNDGYWNGGFYVQDRIQYAGMFLNLGIRADMYFHGDIVNNEDFIEQFNRATGKEVMSFEKLKMVWSPRIGLSIPASASTKIFFNYGYFVQAPGVEELYRDPFLNSSIGNPDLMARKTINYEVGMETEFSENYVLKVKLYGSDKSGDIGYVRTETTPPRSLYENTGFGSSRGFEIEFRKVYSDYFSFTTSYTYLLARGFDLTALQYYELGSAVPPSVREQRVGWDKNHGFKAMVNFEISEYDNLDLFGLNISDMGAYFVFGGFLGRPYTPIIPGAIYVESNSEDGPGEVFLDATFHKGFQFFGFRSVIFLEVKNLLGIRNINIRDDYGNFTSGFNRRNGEVVNLGDLDGVTDRYLTPHEVNFSRANATYTPDVNIRLGCKLYIK